MLDLLLEVNDGFDNHSDESICDFGTYVLQNWLHVVSC